MPIGPSFGDELRAMGLNGLPICWSSTGVITGRESLNTAQNAKLDQVLAAHNPNAQPVISTEDKLKGIGITNAELKAFLNGVGNGPPGG